MNFILSSLILLPLIGVLLISFSTNINYIRFIAVTISMEVFFLSTFIWFLFDKSVSSFQFCEILMWNFHEILLGIDGISLFFILLTTFLIPLCILFFWDNLLFIKEYLIIFLILEFCLLFLFSTLDLLTFFIFFESVLIPMFIIIGLLGSGHRKVRSGYLFFFYTLLGSVLMFLSIIFIYINTGTLNYQNLVGISLNETIQCYIWVSFMLAFMSKIPMVPFHIWLPEAHVEAPTGASVLLAGILLKLGTYGVLRFLITLFPYATVFFIPIIYTIAGISIIYTSGTAIRQTDLKRVIAYTSVAHMNLVVIAMFTFNIISLEGSIFQMLSHGIVSSALFFCVGIIYERYHTRIIENFGGAVQILPIFSVLFFIFILANLGFPCTCNFVGEFLMLSGIFTANSFITLIGISGMVFSGAYSLWIYNRVCFGNIKIKFVNDLDKKEFFILFILAFFTIFFGIYPKLISDYLSMSLYNILEIVDIANFK